MEHSIVACRGEAMNYLPVMGKVRKIARPASRMETEMQYELAPQKLGMKSPPVPM